MISIKILFEEDSVLHTIHQISFFLHVVTGGLALLIFWVPMLSKKGNRTHRNYGEIFVYGMYAVSISGFIMTLLVLADPIGIRKPERNLTFEEANDLAYQYRIFAGFLFMLSLLVFSNIRQSILVLNAKAERQILRSTQHIALLCFLGCSGIVVAVIGFAQNILLFKIFSILSIVSSIGMLHYIFKPNLKPREWIIAHLGNIIGAGIAAYTAFFAFGGSRLFAAFLSGNLQVIPWVLPGIIGTIASIHLTKKYRKKFSVA